VVIFALVSLVQDEKIKTVLSRHYNKTWKKFYKRVKQESLQVDNFEETEKYEQKFF
jgi:hypothetical protein